MVQLQLSGLMISKECGAVPMDAATRAVDLIDLIARVIAAVFHDGVCEARVLQVELWRVRQTFHW